MRTMPELSESPGSVRASPAAGRSHAAVALSLAASLLATGCESPPKPLPPTAPAVAGSAPGPARGGGAFEWTSAADRVEGELARSLSGGPVVARSTDQRVWVVLPGDASFEPGRSALRPAARGWLDRVAAASRGWPASELRIVGHTDASGSAAANDALSLDRAASVRDWLVARGVPAPRISVAGRGARDAGLGGAAGDRRVEILIGEPAVRPSATGR
jgi:outer membrane protein OmpA-like peptidoglycan-associated protein